MKKLFAGLLVIITILSSTVMTVSAASVEDEIANKVWRIGNFIEDVLDDLPKYSEIIAKHTEKIIAVAKNAVKEIKKLEEDGFFDIPSEKEEIGELEVIVPPAIPTLKVRAGTYNEKSTYIVYGKQVPCHWIHTNNFATAVEILSDVNSEEFLSTEDVEELFLENFGRRALVCESERQVESFLLREVYSGKEYLIPIKEEGLPVEVWKAFASEFEEDFTCEFTILDEEGINNFFEDRIGYAPMLTVWYRGENDVIFDVEFSHLGGEFYLIEAVYSEEHMAWCLTEEALEKFCERNPECAVVSEQ